MLQESKRIDITYISVTNTPDNNQSGALKLFSFANLLYYTLQI